MPTVEINSLTEPTETTVVDEKFRPVVAKLTLAQAEVAVALNQLRTSGDDLPCFQPAEVFPRRDNIHNGARRTVYSLIRKGLIVERPRGHYPQYQVTQALFDALREWRINPKNYEKFQAFELSCY